MSYKPCQNNVSAWYTCMFDLMYMHILLRCCVTIIQDKIQTLILINFNIVWMIRIRAVAVDACRWFFSSCGKILHLRKICEVRKTGMLSKILCTALSDRSVCLLLWPSPHMTHLLESAIDWTFYCTNISVHRRWRSKSESTRRLYYEKRSMALKLIRNAALSQRVFSG